MELKFAFSAEASGVLQKLADEFGISPSDVISTAVGTYSALRATLHDHPGHVLALIDPESDQYIELALVEPDKAPHLRLVAPLPPEATVVEEG